MNVLTSILLICAAGMTLAWLVAAQRRLVARLARRFLVLPRLQQVAIVLAVGVMTVCAQKQGTSNREQGTSAVAEASGSDFNAENGDLRTETRSSSQISATSDTSKLRAKTALTSTSANPCESVKSVDKNLPRVTTNDVSRGYALVEVRTNAAVSYGMPTNGTEVGTWGKTGAYRDVVRVSLDFSHGDTCTVETRSVSEGRFGEAEPEGRASVCETRSGEIIELSNNRIIESAEASASGSDDSRRAAENAEVGTVVPQAEEESLSNHNSIIRQFDYSIIHSFPLGDSIISSLWAHTWGTVRPRLRDRVHEIVAVGTPMSCVAGEGRLWTAATTNGGWAITWEKFREGRRKREIIELSNNRIIESAEAEASSSDGSRRAAENAEVETAEPQAEEESLSNHNSIIRQFDNSIIDSNDSASPSLLNLRVNKNISAQIELFPNGDFITRSNEVERVYRRVNPDDWDDDGIENEEDDEPMIAAEETQFGPNQTLPDGANSNAYCWVDLVVPRTNAKVTFVGDGASDLADPSFIAKVDETYRVAILIGKTYRVTCPLPFRIAAKSSDEIVETWNGVNEVELCWPVSVNSCVTDDDAESDAQRAAIRQIQVVDASNYTLSPLMTLAASVDANTTTTTTRTQSFVMSVVPAGLGGLFNWTKHCCSISGTGYAFEQTCRGKCDCSNCPTEGYFEYEGYRLPVYGPSCPCSGESVDDYSEGGDDDDPPSRGVSAYFTKSVIFFEDEYDNSPTEHVGWRSTETVLKCSANGGEQGGLVKIEIEGADGLVQYNGESLPYMKSLEPNETISFKNTYRAVKESNVAAEIKVKATFVENEADWSQETTDEATVVKVEIYPELSAPENECTFRRKLGVGETLNCRYYPSVTGLRWTGGSGTWLGTGPSRSYVCALRAEKDMILLRGLGCVYSPAVRVVEPQGVLSSDVGCQTFGLLPGKAGGLVLVQRLHVLPLDVSFQGVRIEEVPDAGSLKSGYFADTYFMNEWSHGPRQGAGVWQTVVSRNEFLLDSAGFVCELPQLDDAGFVSSLGTNGWSAGELTWNVPCGWASQSAEDGEVPVGQFAESALQEMAIDASGNFSVRKHSNSASRSISGKITVNDKELE